jgi:hypothetical protein
LISVSETKHIRLALADRLIAKNVAVSELSQISRSEKRTFLFLEKSWEERKKVAIEIASKYAEKTKDADLIFSKINSIMEKWKDDVLKIFATEFSSAYRLARIVGYKKATGQIKTALQYGAPNYSEIKKAKIKEVLPNFDLIDDKNITALTKHQTFWIGDFWDKNVSSSIAKTTKDVIAQTGGGSAIAGKLMKEKVDKDLSYVRLPTGFVGTPKQYFEGLTANAFTVARAHGQMRSFSDIGITKYVITNPLDNRTCPTCEHMDGKEFTVRQGVDQMHSELKAKNKDQVKSVHPWLSLGKIKSISPNAGKSTFEDSIALAGEGQSLPPYHYKCRCGVDISTESMRYEDLEPLYPPSPDEPAKPTESIFTETKTQDDKTFLFLQYAIPENIESKTIAGIKTDIVRMIGFDDEKKLALFKQSKDKNFISSENAFYKIDRIIGGNTIVPPTTKRNLLDKGEGVLQNFDNNWKEVKEIKEKDQNRILLLDFISGNASRTKNSIFESSKGLRVINNGNAFLENPKGKFLYSTNNKKNIINKSDINGLKNVDYSTLAKLLKSDGLSKDQTLQVFYRMKLLENNSSYILDKKIENVWSELYKKPSSLLFSKDIKAISKILNSVYKK